MDYPGLGIRLTTRKATDMGVGDIPEHGYGITGWKLENPISLDLV